MGRNGEGLRAFYLVKGENEAHVCVVAVLCVIILGGVVVVFGRCTRPTKEKVVERFACFYVRVRTYGARCMAWC